MKIEQILQDNNYQFLGWANAWEYDHDIENNMAYVRKGQSTVFDNCTHELKTNNISMHVSINSCPKCKFYYKVDSS